MEQSLRLGRAPDPLSLEEQTDEFGLFKSSQQAYQQDVVPRSRGLDSSAPAPAPAAQPKGKFSFDLYGSADAAPAPAAPTAPTKGKGFEFNLYEDQTAAPVAKTSTESGDTTRGFTAALEQTPALLKGAVGFAGAAGEKAFGEGGMFSSLKKYGLEGYKKGMEEVQARSKDTDDVTQAWAKAKDGDLGALVDWAQYGIGYLGGNIVETVATSLLGAGVGALASGPAAPAGAVAGAVTGAVGKEAVKGVTRNLIESMVSKEAARLAEKAGAETATDVMLKQATKNVAKGIGSTAALAGSGIIKSTGGIYGEAEEEASKDGRELDGGDLARIFGAGVVAGLSEAAVDRLGLSAAAGKISIPGGGRVGRAFVGGAAGVGIEGGQELFQTAVERFGAAKDLTGEDAMRDYINGFALGGLGGGSIGAITGAFRSGKQKPDRVKEWLKDAETELTSDDGRRELFDAMSQDEKIAPILQSNGIESAEDPRFTTVVTKALATQKMLLELEAPTPEQMAETRKEREADVQAAFGDTASTAVGVGTGANEPVIQRSSVTPNLETRTLEGDAQPAILPEGPTTQAGTVALAPEDIVSRTQGYEVEPAFQIGGNTVGNRFMSTKQAETFLFGPVNKETGKREGGYASSVDDLEFQIRQGKRSKEAGGGTFYFIESRPKSTVVQQIDAAANETNTAPTDKQKASGVYKKGRVKVAGVNIAIENPRGSVRSGTSAEGKAWKTDMVHHYGYVSRTKGKDGDQVDVFIGPNPESNKVFVVDQKNPDGTFDEHKAMLGFDTIEDAQAGYMANYTPDWQGMGAISEMPVEAFKSWVKDGKKRKPVAYQPPAAPAAQPAAPATEAAAPSAPAVEPAPAPKVEAAPNPKVEAAPEVKVETKKAEAPKKTKEQEIKEKVAAEKADKAAADKAAAEVKEAKRLADTAELKRKTLQKGRLALGKKQWGTYAPDGVKWDDIAPEAQQKWADAVADGKPNMALAEEIAPKPKKTKAQEQADANIDKVKVPSEVVTEFWEDQDDGSVPHVAWSSLSKDRQRDWKEAVEDGYASADLHDKLVEAELQNGRADRITAKVKATRDTDVDGTFRTGGKATGMVKADVEALFKRIITGWRRLPSVVVVQSESQLPVTLLNQIKRDDVSGKVPGIYRNGKVYLVADNLSNAKEVVLTVTHEIAGHFGLRSILGGDYAKTMNEIYKGNRSVRKLADEMMVKEGLSLEVAVEEVLADMAEKGASPEAQSALRSIYTAIRKWLRERFNIAFVSENEVRQIVANAREYVIEGKGNEGWDGRAAADAQAAESAKRATGAPTFYSALERAFRGAKDETKPASQWKAWLSSKASELGVKKEEIEWTGINEWLDLQEGKVSKQDVLNFIAGNKIRLNDVILEGTGRFIADDELMEMYAQNEGIGIEDVEPGMSRSDYLDALGMTERMASGTKHGADKLARVLPGGKRQVELVLVEPSSRTRPYKQDDVIHFGDVSGGKAIGWLRMNMRKDANGDDVLFLEEVQSQRGQDIREQGVAVEDVEAERRRLQAAGDPAADTVAFDNSKRVPDAPFIKDTKAWTGLLLKRAIAYAQEQGVTKIAWTTGDQQVERYRLDKSVDEMSYDPTLDGGTLIVTAKDAGPATRPMIDRQNVKPEDLPDIIGKDAADKLLTDPTDRDGSTVTLKGLDLQLGGSGVRKYYDTIIPSVAKDLIKKFGGTTVVMDIDGTGQQLGFVIPEKLQQTVAEDGLPMFRRKDYEAQFDDLPADVRDMAVAKGHYSPPTIKQRLDSLKPKLWLRVVQGTFDRFRSVRDIDLKAYMQLRMSSTVDGALEGLLHYGQVFDDDGALNLKKGSKGLIEILGNVGPETDRFLMWIAANRAGELKKQDRERFFSDDEISALKRINAGKMKDGKPRAAVYAKTLSEMNELNRSVLDVARETGLLDEAGYKRFASDIWYIPFYRQMDDDRTLSAAQNSSASVGQYLSKNLKGSERQLNDLMENVLLNWSHILSASMKNKAANTTLDSATQMGGIVTKLERQEKGAVKTMVKGKEAFWRIDDEFLLASLDAVANVPSYGMWTNLAREFKTTLTRFISLSPTFKINNLIRDSIQSVGLSELDKNPLANVLQGMRAYKNERAEALVGGGLFAMGNAFDGDRASGVKRLLKIGVPNQDIWSTDEKIKNGLKKVWNAYDEASDAMENANRLALYQQLRANGTSHLEAAYAARDLQDFSLQGNFVAIRYLSQILPYFNARLQGMYKLGRDGLDPSIAAIMGRADDSQRQKAAKFGVVLGAVTMAGLALYLNQMDDDDWKKREEWDRDMFFWFKIPGTDTAIRIPKPFEMGAFATIVERLTEQIVDKDVEGKVFGKRLAAVLSDNLAINLIPQIVRPLYDLARNKDGFTDRPIESMGMERLSPENRVNAGTSAAAVALGTVNDLFADFASAATGGALNANNMKMSPIQYDYLIRGYLGWLGTAIQTTSNLAVAPFKEGESPDKRIDDLLVVGNYVKSLPANQSRFVSSFYENAKEIATATADMKSFIAAGNMEKAIEVADQKRDLIGLSKMFTHVQDKMSTISKQIKRVTDDPEMPGDQKRLEIDRLSQLRIEYAKRAEEARVARRRGE